MVILKEKINKEFIAFTLFSLINMLFGLKYLYRVNAVLAIVVTLLYPIGVCLVRILRSQDKLKVPFAGWIGVLLLFVINLMCLLVLGFLP